MDKTTIKSIVHLCAPNDTNGNPRRLWVGRGIKGQVVKVEDEGYGGKPQWARDADYYDLDVYVSASEYKRFVKWGASIDKVRTDGE